MEVVNNHGVVKNVAVEFTEKLSPNGFSAFPAEITKNLAAFRHMI